MGVADSQWETLHKTSPTPHQKPKNHASSGSSSLLFNNDLSLVFQDRPDFPTPPWPSITILYTLFPDWKRALALWWSCSGCGGGISFPGVANSGSLQQVLCYQYMQNCPTTSPSKAFKENYVLFLEQNSIQGQKMY